MPAERNAKGEILKKILSTVLLISACASKAPQQTASPGAEKTEISYAVDAAASSKKTLLLRDFQPQTMMKSVEHHPQKAKFPVFDTHSHINDAKGIHPHQPPAQVLSLLDQANVRTVAILTGAWGDRLQKVVDEMVTPYPGRFIVFAEIDWSKADEPNFVENMVVQLRDSVRRGARGLKILKDFGLGYRDRNGQLLKIDDPRFDPIWAECGRLGIPVGIHSTDPEAFFLPIDAHNERYDELIEYPEWSFPADKFPSKRSLLEARNRVFARHPKTQFIAYHFANWPENVDEVEKWMNQYPNVTIDFAARVAELGRQPKRARAFFMKYQDRILFGSDFEIEKGMYQNIFRWLETEDEYFDYWLSPGQGRWKIYGLGLPDSVLKKIYYANAERLLGTSPSRRSR